MTDPAITHLNVQSTRLINGFLKRELECLYSDIKQGKGSREQKLITCAIAWVCYIFKEIVSETVAHHLQILAHQLYNEEVKKLGAFTHPFSGILYHQ